MPVPPMSVASESSFSACYVEARPALRSRCVPVSTRAVYTYLASRTRVSRPEGAAHDAR